jgi:hypothetical protein
VKGIIEAKKIVTTKDDKKTDTVIVSTISQFRKARKNLTMYYK